MTDHLAKLHPLISDHFTQDQEHIFNCEDCKGEASKLSADELVTLLTPSIEAYAETGEPHTY